MTDEQKIKLHDIIYKQFKYYFPNKINNVVSLSTEYYPTGYYHVSLLIPESVNLRYANSCETQLIALLGNEFLLKQEMTNIKFNDKVIEDEEEIFVLELSFYIVAR